MWPFTNVTGEKRPDGFLNNDNLYKRAGSKIRTSDGVNVVFNLKGAHDWLATAISSAYPNAVISPDDGEGRLLDVTFSGDEASRFLTELKACTGKGI